MKTLTPLSSRSFAYAAVNDINHVALAAEVQYALAQWIKAKSGQYAAGVLIGGLALSFYAKPRHTEDVDLLFLSPSDIPDDVPSFKRVRNGAFREDNTHVEIEVVTHSSFTALPQSIVQKVIDTAHNKNGLRVASLEGLIALKLFAADNPRRRRQDVADIERVLCNHPRPDMSDWNLNDNHVQVFNEICADVYEGEKHDR